MCSALTAFCGLDQHTQSEIILLYIPDYHMDGGITRYVQITRGFSHTRIASDV